MIVPGPRLILFAGVAFLPAAALGTASGSPAAWAVAAAFLVLAAADAALSRRAFRGIGAELPPLVRLAEDRPGAVEVTIRNEGKAGSRLRLGLALPRGLESERRDLRVDLPPGRASFRVAWPLVPRKRGRYVLDACHMERPSPLGLWAVRKSDPARAEVRVYPDLLAERRHVGALFLNRGTSGIHTQRQVGKGRDFEKLREYLPGDGYDDIHWKATAKRGFPVTKVYQIERTQEVYVVLDVSRLSARPAGPGGKRILDRYVTAATLLAMAAERQGDLFGLAVFGDRVHRFIRAKAGKGHVTACLEALYAREPQTASPDFDELVGFLRLRLRRRALLVFLTSLDDPLLAEGFARSAEALGGRHLVLAGMIRPAEARPLFDRPGAVAEPADLYRALVGHIRWHDLRELGNVLRRRGARLALLDDATMCGELVSRYLDIKKRQIL